MIIIEKFTNVGGHYPTQIEAIRRLSDNEPLEIITATDSLYKSNYNNVTLFCLLSTYRDRKSQYSSAIENDAAEVTRFFQMRQLSGLTPVIMPSFDSYDIRLILNILSKTPAMRQFHARILDERFISELAENEINKLREHVCSGNIRLLTETFSLSKRLLSRFNLPSKASFLLPCAVFPDSDSLSSGQENSPRPYRIGFLGGRRREKGYKKIPSILREIARRARVCDLGAELEFLMQDNRSANALYDMIYNINIRYGSGSFPWKLNNNIRITKTNAFLDDADFIRTIRSIDVLIIPYSVDSYRYRGSAIVVDGVLSRTPIVYTRGIGMSDYLEHGNAEAASSPEEFAEKIFKILLNLTEYRAKTDAAREVMLWDLENTAAYIRSLANGEASRDG